jgi:hypothetical protein
MTLPRVIGNLPGQSRRLRGGMSCRPWRRSAITDDGARLGADVVRYSFIAVDFHHLLLAGLPAHSHPNVRDDRDTPLLARRDGESKPHISEKRNLDIFRAAFGRALGCARQASSAALGVIRPTVSGRYAAPPGSAICSSNYIDVLPHLILRASRKRCVSKDGRGRRLAPHRMRSENPETIGFIESIHRQCRSDAMSE